MLSVDGVELKPPHPLMWCLISSGLPLLLVEAVAVAIAPRSISGPCLLRCVTAWVASELRTGDALDRLSYPPCGIVDPLLLELSFDLIYGEVLSPELPRSPDVVLLVHLTLIALLI